MPDETTGPRRRSQRSIALTTYRLWSFKPLRTQSAAKRKQAVNSSVALRLLRSLLRQTVILFTDYPMEHSITFLRRLCSFTLIIPLAVVAAERKPAAPPTIMVKPDSSGRLTYTPDEAGNNVVDFSH